MEIVRTAVIVLAVVLGAMGPARAVEADEPEVRPEERAQLLRTHVQGLMKQVELVMMAVSDLVERKADIEEIVVHGALKRYTKRVKGLRAVIVTDGKGLLKFDSFSYPAPKLDLSDRTYIKAAKVAIERGMMVTKPVTGRTSGLPFIPVVNPVFDASDALIAVVVGILVPDAVIPKDMVCARCFASVFDERETLVARHPTAVDTEVVNTMMAGVVEAFDATGTLSGQARELYAHTAWSRLDEFKLFVTYSHYATTK